MSAMRCFKPSCELDVQYLCNCSSPIIYSCDFHFGRHLKLRNRTHNFEYVLGESCEDSKGALNKVKLKKEELRDKVSTYPRNSKNSLKRIKLDMELNNQKEVNILRSQLNQTIENPKNKIIETKIAQQFNLPMLQTYKEFDCTGHWFKYLYLIEEKSKKPQLIIYDTESKDNKLSMHESEREEIKILKPHDNLDRGTCIAQLPNGELFCFGNFKNSGVALIIESDYRVRVLPFGAPCHFSSAIYFNGNIYCFGGYGTNYSSLALSSRFDLNRNRWIKLKPMPESGSSCKCVAYNGNILIAGINKNILIYSIDIDSFSTIPYDFRENIKKILIKAEERLCLIIWREFGKMYESEIGDEYTWKEIGNSGHRIVSFQVYCLYRKGVIYIGCSAYYDGRHACEREYIKFHLDKKYQI